MNTCMLKIGWFAQPPLQNKHCKTKEDKLPWQKQDNPNPLYRSVLIQEIRLKNSWLCWCEPISCYWLWGVMMIEIRKIVHGYIAVVLWQSELECASRLHFQQTNISKRKRFITKWAIIGTSVLIPGVNSKTLATVIPEVQQLFDSSIF